MTKHTPGKLYLLGDENGPLAFYGSNGLWYDADNGDEISSVYECDTGFYVDIAGIKATEQLGAFDKSYAELT